MSDCKFKLIVIVFEMWDKVKGLNLFVLILGGKGEEKVSNGRLVELILFLEEDI